MNSKDKMENLTKEGCSRVIAYTNYRIVHSYTLECGFHCSNYMTELPPAANSDKRPNGQPEFVQDETENINSPIYG